MYYNVLNACKKFLREILFAGNFFTRRPRAIEKVASPFPLIGLAVVLPDHTHQWIEFNAGKDAYFILSYMFF